MGTKLNPGNFDCYKNADDNEPMFILLARDISAPTSVLFWALQRANLILKGEKPGADVAMVEEAVQCSIAMIAYKGKKDGAVDNLLTQVSKALLVIKTIRGETDKPGELEITGAAFKPFPGNGLHGSDGAGEGPA